MKLFEVDLFDGAKAVVSATDFVKLLEGSQIIFI
jgi:hypothetical protein